MFRKMKMTKAQKLANVLSRFDCAGLDYEPSDYVSVQTLIRAKGGHSFRLVFAYNDKRNPVLSRDLIIKKDDTAFEVYKLLSWGMNQRESEDNDMLDMLTGNTEDKSPFEI